MSRIVFADGTVWDRTEIGAWATGLPVVGGTEGADVLTGTSAAEALLGREGDDTLDGGAGADQLLGGDGDDVLRMGADAGRSIDVLDGGAGLDTADFSGFAAAVWVDMTYSPSAGREAWTRDAAQVTSGTWREIADLKGVENVTGSAFANQVWGTAGANTLAGSGGADLLDGRGGDDRLDGGAGQDTLTGGAGSDIFVFTPGFGRDVVTDFAAGAGSADMLAFGGGVFADLAAVLAASAQVGTDVVIMASAADAITLRNVQLASLHVDDFRFV